MNELNESGGKLENNQALSEIQKLLELAVSRNASDLHIMVGAYPTLRIDGNLTPITNSPIPTPENVERIVLSLCSPEQKEILLTNKEIDFSFALGELARFRVNAFHQKGYLAASLRLIPAKISTMEELHLPRVLQNFTKLKQGLVLVTGPTGHGKTTTLASMVNQINEERSAHIITIEDPIEYIYPSRKSLIAQREMNLDTHSWEMALRSALREDPDVVLVGEMRDYDTISSVLTVAETGHLVFSTLHTNSASQTIDRIIDVFPLQQQVQARLQLSGVLSAVISERLVPAIDGGRLPVTEILIANPAVSTIIRDGKTHLLDNVIRTSADSGMTTLENSMATLIRSGNVSLDEAIAYCLNPEDLMRLVRS